MRIQWVLMGIIATVLAGCVQDSPYHAPSEPSDFSLQAPQWNVSLNIGNFSRAGPVLQGSVHGDGMVFRLRAEADASFPVNLSYRALLSEEATASDTLLVFSFLSEDHPEQSITYLASSQGEWLTIGGSFMPVPEWVVRDPQEAVVGGGQESRGRLLTAGNIQLPEGNWTLIIGKRWATTFEAQIDIGKHMVVRSMPSITSECLNIKTSEFEGDVVLQSVAGPTAMVEAQATWEVWSGLVAMFVSRIDIGVERASVTMPDGTELRTAAARGLAHDVGNVEAMVIESPVLAGAYEFKVERSAGISVLGSQWVGGCAW